MALKAKVRFELPDPKGLEKLDIPVLDKHTGLIYHPFSGILYRKRFKMVLEYLTGEEGMVLEAGCGRGLLLPELSRRSGRVYGLDLHPRLDVVKGMIGRHSLGNIKLTRGNITQLPYKDKTFDAIICVSVLEHFQKPQDCLAEFWRVLKDNGKLLLGFPVKNKFTDLLFKMIKCDADAIHPSGHRQIIEACGKLFRREESQVYPGFLPRDWSLYFAGKFGKR